jgi:hypothetical protein
MGGLGNQLCQYALYEKFKSIEKIAKLDLHDYYTMGEDREWRRLELDSFDGLTYETCTVKERIEFLDSDMKLPSRIRRKLFGRKSLQLNDEGEYIPDLLDMDNVYLYGYWDCERYYGDIMPLLREKIKFAPSNNPRNSEIMKKMESENSVSIHIRRQDYLTVADGKRYMGICTEQYYAKAMEHIEEKVPNTVYYIFSDDIEYAKAHFNNENMHVVDWNTGNDSMHDMELMSHCKHNICANSTFSIWGARLNRNPYKIMVRPLKHDNYEKIDKAKTKENWKNWVLIDEHGELA